VHAWVLEHESGPRPWVVCVHGFGMGHPTVDFHAFQAQRLHRDLGLNVVIPCLPLHGPRTATRFSGGQLLAPDYLNMIHLFSQAVWDIRRILRWIRRRGGEKVGLYGVSLGAYNSALVASIEPGIDCVIVGIPAVDFPNLARDNEPWVMRRYYDDEFDVDWQMVRALTHVVSPLALQPKVPLDRRFLFAGIADRVVKPDQARALWRHWGPPEIFWFSGGHVLGQMKGAIADYVDRCLRSAGFLRPRLAPARGTSRPRLR
jgi:dienelactone hydrolase